MKVNRMTRKQKITIVVTTFLAVVTIGSATVLASDNVDAKASVTWGLGTAALSLPVDKTGNLDVSGVQTVTANAVPVNLGDEGIVPGSGTIVESGTGIIVLSADAALSVPTDKDRNLDVSGVQTVTVSTNGEIVNLSGEITAPGSGTIVESGTGIIVLSADAALPVLIEEDGK